MIAAGLYPLMFLIYGEVANTFVDFEKYKKKVELNETFYSTPSVTFVYFEKYKKKLS